MTSWRRRTTTTRAIDDAYDEPGEDDYSYADEEAGDATVAGMGPGGEDEAARGVDARISAIQPPGPGCGTPR